MNKLLCEAVFLLSFLVPLFVSGAAVAASGGTDYTVDAVRVESGIEVQDITYRSDGLRVKGLLFTSPAEGPRPAIVFNHGGVSGISRDMVRRSVDLARAGYMVFTPAYRGEGGSEGKVEVADGEVTDVLEAAEILRQHPRVDPERVALVGSSHGALVSVLAAAREPRFKAVAAACGVMDVVSWYRYLVDNGFDVTDSLSRAVYGYGPDDRPEAFRIRNALLVAPKLQVPILFQQGMKDRIVPPDQPWRMASALERAGHMQHEVRTYPLLGHAFWFWNDTKSHTVAEVKQADESWGDLMAFLNRHLAPGVAAPATGSVIEPPPPPEPLPASASPYEQEIRSWQDRRRKRLLADDGWLTVAGLHWLKPGINRLGSDTSLEVVLPGPDVPRVAATLRLSGETVILDVPPGVTITHEGKPVTNLTLTSDAEGTPQVLSLGSYRFFLIKRSRGLAIRVRDLNAPARQQFTGIETFPVDSTWRVEARFVPYEPPKPVEIPNILGTVDTLLAPGYVEFDREGQTWRLDPVLEDAESEEFFIIFKDGTSASETYPPGRFLYTPLPVDGRVVLDFNKAYNPPCAFTDFATCPLPPEQNTLTLRVTAGEKNYGAH